MTYIFKLSNHGVSQIDSATHDYEIQYTRDISKTWDEIITHIRNGNISVLNAQSEQLRARTIVNKILTQFI